MAPNPKRRKPYPKRIKMVLTPDFRLSQTDSQVLIYINIPNVRVSGMELTVLPDMDFSFYCRPYLLRLQLPGQVHDEDDPDETKRPRATYDPNTSNGLLTVNLSKRNAGEQFEGLDMITTLLKAGSVRPRTGTGRHGLGVDGEGAYGFMNGEPCLLSLSLSLSGSELTLFFKDSRTSLVTMVFCKSFRI